jgi:hypothetical protein
MGASAQRADVLVTVRDAPQGSQIEAIFERAKLGLFGARNRLGTC